MLRFLKRLPAYLLGLWVLSMLVIFLLQDAIIFQPTKLNLSDSLKIDISHQEFFLHVGEQDSVHSVFIKSPTQPSKGVILYLHGNADNLQRWAKNHHDFTTRGYDFFAIDYRGYGKSSGKPSESNLYEDARKAYDYLHKTYNAPQIIIYGRSLGTGVAAQLASQVPSKCLVLETPYNNIECAIAKQIFLDALPFNLRTKLQTEGHIPKISCPIYAFHGTTDGVVKYSCAIKIKKILPNEHFITIDGGGHKNLNTFPLYQKKIDEILK
jgi:uncharacterized protein